MGTVRRVPVITNAQPSADERLRRRRRVYTAIMTVHLVGFAVGASLYERAWLAGLIILIVTGPLQWVAVVLANAAPRRRGGLDEADSRHDPTRRHAQRSGDSGGGHGGLARRG